MTGWPWAAAFGVDGCLETCATDGQCNTVLFPSFQATICCCYFVIVVVEEATALTA